MHGNDNKFGKRLKAAMRGRGVTQSELAAKLGLTQGHLSHLVTGRRNPSLNLAQEIARVLKMTLQELMGDDLRIIESPDEKTIIDVLRNLSEDERKVVLDMAKILAEKN